MRDGDLAVVAARVGSSGMALKQHPMGFHHPMDALGVDRRQAFLAALALEHRPNAAIAIGRLIADDRLDPGDELFLRHGRAPNPFKRLGDGSPEAGGDVRSSDAERFTNGFHRMPSLGAESARTRCFFWPPASSRASLRISASIVFLPSRRCISRSWLCRAR